MSQGDASWRPDPAGRHQYRYWDGSGWTDQVSDDGVISSDPYDDPSAVSTGPAGFAASAAPAPGATGPTSSAGSNKVGFVIGGVLLLVLLGAGIWFLTQDDEVGSAQLAAAFEDSGIPEDEAQCLAAELDGVFSEDRIRELGESDAQFTAEETAAMFEAASECDTFGGVDPEGIGSSEGDSYGDNAELDALWDACEGGDDAACDDLYWESGVGTEYEEFGRTCGGRSEDGIAGTCDS